MEKNLFVCVQSITQCSDDSWKVSRAEPSLTIFHEVHVQAGF